jgi:predicted dehydrogenase
MFYHLDVVYIGVIHISHVALSKQMLRSGKHVLCEKPMGASLIQVLEVQEVAREFSKFFMEVNMYKCHFNFKEYRYKCIGSILFLKNSF